VVLSAAMGGWGDGAEASGTCNQHHAVRLFFFWFLHTKGGTHRLQQPETEPRHASSRGSVSHPQLCMMHLFSSPSVPTDAIMKTKLDWPSCGTNTQNTQHLSEGELCKAVLKTGRAELPPLRGLLSREATLQRRKKQSPGMTNGTLEKT
jgi:hypothetical protein